MTPWSGNTTKIIRLNLRIDFFIDCWLFKFVRILALQNKPLENRHNNRPQREAIKEAMDHFTAKFGILENEGLHDRKYPHKPGGRINKPGELHNHHNNNSISFYYTKYHQCIP